MNVVFSDLSKGLPIKSVDLTVSEIEESVGVLRKAWNLEDLFDFPVKTAVEKAYGEGAYFKRQSGNEVEAFGFVVANVNDETVSYKTLVDVEFEGSEEPK